MLSRLRSTWQWQWIWRTTSFSLWSVAGAIFIQDNVLEITRVTGNSMAPTLSPNYNTTGEKHRMLWSKWMPTEDLKRGDLVFYRSPGRPEDCSVKRVIALPGDAVILDPRRRPARERDGADLPESRGWDSLRGKLESVPEGHVWLEGDNWRQSRDSNAYGPISKSLIIGKAVCVTYPWNRFGTKPWEDKFKSRTKVVPGKVKKEREGEVEGLVEAIRHG